MTERGNLKWEVFMGRKALPTDEMNLTKREHQILGFLKENIVKRGYPPTVREIGQHLGVKSTSTVHKDLSALEEKGFIRRDPAKPRAIEVADLDMSVLAGDETSANDAKQSSPPADDAPIFDNTNILNIPLVGQVAAGTPILAEQNVTEYFPVPTHLINNSGNHFMLTVKGESMIEAGIFDGDYILVKQQAEARNGDMVVAMVDGFESEATVKTFYRENDHIRLQPENSSMSPIIVRNVRILGIVKGVFRYLN